MREKLQAFVIASGFGLKKRLIAASVFRNGTRDSVVKASVQCPEVLSATCIDTSDGLPRAHVMVSTVG
jgi:hypothetical protein